jgi:N6-L-threonylcarbamoyladenine synthase
LLRDGRQILANVVSSQIEVHRPYGGVVPELASRHHIQNIVPVLRQCLASAAMSLDDVQGIAVTRGPGLAGALLVGLQAAKALAYVKGLPLVGINHLEGHLCAPTLDAQRDAPPERHVALLVSGGHTCLVLVESFGRYRMLGASRDDAAGEAFDKVAKLLQLGYPGGPIVEQFAASGDGRAVHLPRALPGRDDLDFSFSGLKTAVANRVRQTGRPQGQALADLCASFQRAVAEVLVRKACQAVRRARVDALVAGGGVIANTAIRAALAEAAEREGFALHVPPIGLCTDNAAMIAAAGYRRLQAGERGGLDLSVAPRLPL